MVTKSSNKMKKVNVNRKFMMDLANRIYNPTSRKFLRLCNGTLQNGPDPKDPRRPMHCGLGELYFAMTGKQPEETRISEEGVIDLAVQLSPLDGAADKARKEALDAVKALKVSEYVKDQITESLENIDNDDLTDNSEVKFREALNEIPGANDQDNDGGCRDGSCSFDTYRSRSARVAKLLREAAKLLPA